MNVNYKTKSYYIAIAPKENTHRTNLEGILFDPMYKRNKDNEMMMEVAGYDCRAKFHCGGDNRAGNITCIAIVSAKPLKELFGELKREYKITTSSIAELAKNGVGFITIKPKNAVKMLEDLTANPAKYL